jgi:hypothetical protein
MKRKFECGIVKAERLYEKDVLVCIQRDTPEKMKEAKRYMKNYEIFANVDSIEISTEKGAIKQEKGIGKLVKEKDEDLLFIQFK